MGQFKPMVKMETTEPSIELKLKKGGSVSDAFINAKKSAKSENGHNSMPCKADGGAMDFGRMMGKDAMISPMAKSKAAKVGKPSLAERRKAMSKVMGKKDGGETKAVHKSEMARIGKVEKELKSHEGKPASKAHKGMKDGGKCYATGGVVKGNGGGYKTGGVVKGNGGGYATGGVVNGQGGYKDGGAMHKMPDGSMMKGKKHAMKSGGGLYANINAKRERIAEGSGEKMRKVGSKGSPTAKNFKEAAKTAKPMKEGGALKKYASGGSVNDSGKAEQMAQGKKKASAPVAINMLSGAFKKGGNVSSKKLQAMFNKENAPAMKAAKANSNEKYSPYQKKCGGKVRKMADGGSSYDESFDSPEEQLREMRRMRNLAKGEKSMANIDLEENMENDFDLVNKIKEAFSKVKGALKGQGAVTDTERTISRTVSPSSMKGMGNISDEEGRMVRKMGPAKKCGGKVKK